MPNRVNTIDHKSKAIEQWIRRWSTDSPFLLHIQHQSKIKICRFLRLSIVKIFPKAAVHTKKATLEGTLDFQTVFQLKLRTCELMGKHDASPSHSKFPLLVIKKLLNGNSMPREVGEVFKSSFFKFLIIYHM